MESLKEKQILKNLEERNELVELLQDIGRDWDNYIDECQESETTPCIDYDDFHADSILAAGYRKQEWISVDERLPEDVYGKDREQITVLVYTEGKKVSQCSRCAEYKLIEREPLERDVWRRTGNFYWNKSKRVTHWMPLPEPPKMKGDKQ